MDGDPNLFLGRKEAERKNGISCHGGRAGESVDYRLPASPPYYSIYTRNLRHTDFPIGFPQIVMKLQYQPVKVRTSKLSPIYSPLRLINAVTQLRSKHN